MWYLREENVGASKRERGEWENVDGMITAITVSQDTRSSCQGEAEGGSSQAVPNATAEREEYSREFQLLRWMPRVSWVPCRSVVWKGRRGVVFCKGSEGRVLKEMQSVVTVQLCRKFSVKHSGRLGQQKASLLSFLKVRKAFGQLTIVGRKQWWGEIKASPCRLAHLSKGRSFFFRTHHWLLCFSSLHIGPIRKSFWS